MTDREREAETEKKWERAWRDIWRPLLYTDGKLDEAKIKNELHDLWFVYTQVAEVYMELTGGLLSKENYYADTIIRLHIDEVAAAYDEGYDDATKKL